MAPELVPFVFERFRQGTVRRRQSSHEALDWASRSRNTLSIFTAVEIAAASAGPAHGSTFTVMLPLGDRLQTSAVMWTPR